MTILVLGDGLLGTAFKEYGGSIILSKSQCNILKSEDIIEALDTYQPDAVINCAGIVPKHSATIREMFDVNAFGPRTIAELCDLFDIQFIHISTNCVFEGRKEGNYTEIDKPNATDAYGLSKLIGEPDYGLTIRTSFVGLPDPNGRGLLSWAERQNRMLIGYDHVHWNGVTTLSLVGKIFEYIHEDTKGIRHVYGQRMTKYSLLEMANEVFGWGLKVVPESTVTLNIHRENKMLSSVYATGHVVRPLRHQLEELQLWAYQSQSS